MKMYNEEGSVIDVEKEQVDIFFEAGWSSEKIETKVEEPSEEKKKIGRIKKPVVGTKKIHIKPKDE
mgnify:CR=1 FL=1